MDLRKALASLTGLVLLAAGLPGQVVDPGSPPQRPADPPGGSARESPGRHLGPRKGYKGPGDTVGPSPTEEAPESAAKGPAETGRPGTDANTPPIARNAAAGPRVSPASPLIPPAEDLSGWLPWWRFQRWQRLEPRSPDAPPLAVTPREGEVRAPTPLPARSKPAVEVEQALLQALARNPAEPDLRAALVYSLARLGGGPRTRAALREALQDEDQRVLEAATLGLGILREPHAIATLTGMLHDDEIGCRAVARSRVPLRTRAMAAYGLGLIAENTPYAPIRATILSSLLEELRGRASATADLPVACIQALGLFRGTDAAQIVPELMGLLRDSGRRDLVRAQVPVAVAKLIAHAGRADGLARSALEELRKRLLSGHESVEVRQSCALAVGRIGALAPLCEPATLALIQAQDSDADVRVRRLALLALAEVGSRSHAAAQTLALPHLLQSVERGTDADRSWAALALGWCAALTADHGRRLPPRAGAHMLEQLPGSVSPRLRAALSVALGLAGQGAAAAAVADALQSIGDPNLLGEATAGLALLDDPTLRSVITEKLALIDPFLESYQAVCAVLAQRDPDGLLEMLGGFMQRSELRLQGRYVAAIALGWMRDARAVAPLVELLSADEPYFVRAAAAISLGRLAERPGPRWNASYLDLLNPFAAPETLVNRGLGAVNGVCDRL